MEQKNIQENSVVFQINEIIGKMSNQVNFLIRKNLLINQLDLDVLMNNTRTLYDLLCTIKCNMNADLIPLEIERHEEACFDTNIDANTDSDINTNIDADSEIDNNYEDIIEDKVEDDINDNIDNNIEDDFEDNFGDDIEDDFGDDIEDDIEDDIDIKEEDSGIRTYIKTIEPQTIGDKLEQKEDTSLAARLQRKPVSDLMTAIGINDRFLLLNELFDGNMEKYNKSIRALNSFSTLFGARTYMSELQIEFQWDCTSEAYNKLNDLVERRFM